MLEVSSYQQKEIPKSELKLETTRGSGNGGQHKNSTDSCVIITHIPTKIKVVRDGRSQHENKDSALKEITRRVNEYYQTGFDGDFAEERKGQVGSGTRSDKRRTYRVKDGIVVDHITNKSASIKEIFKGKITLLH